MNLCVEGDSATSVFILRDGWTKVITVTDDGHEAVLALRGEGDIVGETAGETVSQRNATVQAITAVQALAIRYRKFSFFLDTHPEANQAYRRVMTQRWRDTDSVLRQRAHTSGAQRIAGLLLQLAGPHGSQTGSAIEIALPLSQEELASLAGTSRATVTRALSNWRKRGLISTGHRHATLIDIPGLRKVAGPAA